MRQLPGVLLAIAAAGAMADRASAQDTAARFRILVPEEAIIYVSGERMRSRGEDRLFESPPLTAGRAYSYEFKAVWQGKEIVREVRFVPGRTVEVDFRPDFGKVQPAEEPPGSPYRRIRPWVPPVPRYC